MSKASFSVKAPAGGELVERARELAPLLAEHSAAAEAQRQPVDEVIEAVRAAGIFDLMVPKAHGGLELDLDTFVEVGLALAEGDASMSWVSSFYIEHNWMLCQFPEAFQNEVFADQSNVLAPAAISLGGQAERVDGGFRLSGRWQWGTGIMHPEWVLVGAIVVGEADELDLRFFALPAGDVTVDDTWHIAGMCGTGSNDIVIEGAFISEERTVSILDMSAGTAPGATIHQGALYRTPMLPILGLAAAMPAVGQARAVVDGFAKRSAERVLMGTAVKQSEKPASQIRLAKADLEASQAADSLRRVAAELMELRDTATMADRARLMAMCCLAVDQSKRVVQSLAEASGASSQFANHPLQRTLRDIQTLSCHVVFDMDSRMELYGRALLGLEVNGLV